MPRPQIEVVRIGEQNLDAEFAGKSLLREPLDGRLRADRHENGGLDGSMRRVQQSRPGACMRALGDDFEGNLGQVRL